MNLAYDSEWDHDARGRGPWQRRLKVARLMARLHYENRTSRSPLVAATGPVVSLTSYGSRIQTVHLTIESIGRGTQLPSRLILWLDDRATLGNLPGTLRRLQHRGLEVLPTEDYRPHKKYFPYVQTQDLSVPLVTADDDVLYPEWWLSGLIAAHAMNPDCVCCYRAHVAKLDGSGAAKFLPYSAWLPCTSTTPSHLNFSTGCSGVLFPPVVLQSLKTAGTGFIGRCDFADDIWLNLHALRTGCKVAQVTAVPIRFLGLLRTQKVGLFRQNLFQGGNDTALSATFEGTDLQRLSKLAAGSPQTKGERRATVDA